MRVRHMLLQQNGPPVTEYDVGNRCIRIHSRIIMRFDNAIAVSYAPFGQMGICLTGKRG